MKTSNKLLLAIGLIIMACLVGYNFALKKEYNKGEFRSPFYGMKKIEPGTFKAIENNAANIVGITVLPGRDCRIYGNTDVVKNITFKNQGGVLQINYIDDGSERRSDGSVFVTCPILDSLVTNAFLNKETKEGIDRYQPYLKNEINHFTQPALKVKVGNYTRINLEKTTLDNLYAVVGGQKTFNAALRIDFFSNIKQADLNVPGTNIIELYSPRIGSITNHISSDAQVLLSNGALGLFTNQPGKSK